MRFFRSPLGVSLIRKPFVLSLHGPWWLQDPSQLGQLPGSHNGCPPAPFWTYPLMLHTASWHGSWIRKETWIYWKKKTINITVLINLFFKTERQEKGNQKCPRWFQHHISNPSTRKWKSEANNYPKLKNYISRYSPQPQAQKLNRDQTGTSTVQKTTLAKIT